MRVADKVEEIIQEIALKHGIAVGRNDPIMILHTLNERLMLDSVAAQQRLLESFKEELEAIAHRWGEDARGRAERMLNVALVASREAMAKTMHDGAQAAGEAMRRELDAALGRLRSAVHEARWVAILNFVGASLVAVAAVAVL